MANFGQSFAKSFVPSFQKNFDIQGAIDDREKRQRLADLTELKKRELEIKEFQLDQANKTKANSIMKELTTQLSKVPEENFATAVNDMFESFPTDTPNKDTNKFNKFITDGLAGLVSTDLNSRDNLNKATDIFDDVDKGKLDITQGINKLIALKHSTTNLGIQGGIESQIVTLQERQAGKRKQKRELDEFKSPEATEQRRLKREEKQTEFKAKERFKASLKEPTIEEFGSDTEGGFKFFRGSPEALTKQQIGKRQEGIFNKEDEVRKLDRLAELIKPGTGGGVSELVQTSLNILTGNIADATSFLEAKTDARKNKKFRESVKKATGLNLFDKNLPKKEVAALDLAFKIAKSTGGVITKADWQFAKSLINDPSGSEATLARIAERRKGIMEDLKVERERLAIIQGKRPPMSKEELGKALIKAKDNRDRNAFDKIKLKLNSLKEAGQ